MSDLFDLQQFTNCPREITEGYYDLKPEKLHFKFLRSVVPTDVLVVYFHGALERSKRAIPSYYPIDSELSPIANQISICDPTMTDRGGFPLSWYLGHENFDCQKKLKQFFSEIKQELRIKKTIFLGSSGGGFASLYYSFFDPDSVALTIVPQTSIIKYHRPKAFEIYSKYCWSSSNYDDIKEHRCLDVCELYKNGFDNTVIYIQSSGDVEHFTNQLVPFLSHISNSESIKTNFILENSYFGKFGHSGVVKKDDYTPMLKSVIQNDVRSNEAVLKGYYVNRNQKKTVVDNKVIQTPNSKLFATNDIAESELVNSYLMSI